MSPLEKVLGKFPDARKVGRGWLAHCPVHGDEHESLGIDEGSDGKVILKCRSQGCTVEAIVAAIGLEMRDLFPEKEAQPRRREDQGQAVRDILARAIEDGGRIKAYLVSRGLDGTVPPSLRFRPSLPYFESGKSKATGSYPAMVAAIVDVNAQVVGVHQTYLAADGPGKAPVESVKKWRATTPGATRGAAVRLGIPTRVVALTEGIETGLAVQQATGTPTWAALSAGGMEAVQLPPEVRQVQVWGDRDPKGAGQQAAEKLARRLAAEGRSVEVFLPAKDGDWLDVLTTDGAAALMMATPMPLEVKPQPTTPPPPRERPTIVALPRERELRRPELERAVIGALLWNPKAYWDSDLDARDFAPGVMQVLLAEATMEAMAHVDRADLLVLSERLRGAGHPMTPTWLAELVRERVDKFDDACAQLRALTMRRETYAHAQALATTILDPTKDASEALALALTRLSATGDRRRELDVIQLNTVVQEEWQRLLRGEQERRLSTGWDSLDRLCGGLSMTDFVVVGARTGKGKSAMLQQLAEQVASQGGWAMNCSPEMNRREQAVRRIARVTGIDVSSIIGGLKTTAARESAERMTPPTAPAGLYTFDLGKQTTRDIEERARRLAAAGPLSLIVVDYIQYLADKQQKGESRQQLIGRMTRALRQLAQTLHVPIVVAAQLGREADKKEPTLRMLREAGDLEQDASQVWLLHQPKGEDEIEVIVAKNRQGKTGRMTLQWNGPLTKFTDPNNDEGPPRDTRFGADF